jgi:hypothetical protein
MIKMKYIFVKTHIKMIKKSNIPHNNNIDKNIIILFKIVKVNYKIDYKYIKIHKNKIIKMKLKIFSINNPNYRY